MKELSQKQRHVCDALQDEQEIVAFIENKMFIKITKFEPLEPASIKDPIIIQVEFKETGTRHLYEGTKPVKNNQQLVEEMNQCIK